VVEEGLEVALEADLFLDRDHLAMNARHLVEADLVDLLGAHVRGRVLAHQVGVPGLAVGQRVEAVGVTTCRQVLVADEVAQPGIGRDELAGDRRLVGRAQARTLRLGHGVGKRRDRPVEQAVRRRRHDVRLELGQGALHQERGLHDLRLHAQAHVHDRLVHPGREPVHALEKVLVIADRREWLGARPGAEHREAVRRTVNLADRQQVVRKTELIEAQARLSNEQLAAEAALRVEGPRRDRLDGCQALLQ
jgi:hypothetical protein